MKNVLILRPFLGVPFKKFSVNAKNDENNLPAIRQHWRNFSDLLETALHDDPRYNVKVLAAPLWQFNNELVKNIAPDIVFVPHKIKEQFGDIGPKTQPYFYHQTVLPWMFILDPLGWGASSSLYPFDFERDNATYPYAWDSLVRYATSGQSKFDQPNMSNKVNPAKDYLFFPCQLPHDETIKYHSQISVAEALAKTLAYGEKTKQPVYVKGHPVNPGSMTELRRITENSPTGKWVDGNIQQLLANCKAVFTVNSGVGMEALLHKKPVFTFGQAEYDVVSFRPEFNGMSDTSTLIDIFERNVDDFVKDKYRPFINYFYAMMMDTSDPVAFNKRLQEIVDA